jgi:hypothetical protein
VTRSHPAPDGSDTVQRVAPGGEHHPEGQAGRRSGPPGSGHWTALSASTWPEPYHELWPGPPWQDCTAPLLTPVNDR